MLKIKTWLNGLALSAFGFVGMAQAAVPADVTSAFGTLETDAGTFMTLVWGVVAIIVIGFVWIKLFRKGLNKAT